MRRLIEKLVARYNYNYCEKKFMYWMEIGDSDLASVYLARRDMYKNIIKYRL